VRARARAFACVTFGMPFVDACRDLSRYGHTFTHLGFGTVVCWGGGDHFSS
jgi:hypothetical protein